MRGIQRGIVATQIILEFIVGRSFVETDKFSEQVDLIIQLVDHTGVGIDAVVVGHGLAHSIAAHVEVPHVPFCIHAAQSVHQRQLFVQRPAIHRK